jgi:hypothetical protein
MIGTRWGCVPGRLPGQKEKTGKHVAKIALVDEIRI